MSLIIEIADAVVTELNEMDLKSPLSAQRHYVPSFELKEMTALRASVVPKGLVITKSDRSNNTFDVQIDVAIQKKFNTEENAEIDPLMELVQEIADRFRLRRLAGYPAAHWIRTENTPIYSPEHWDELRQFTSVLTFTFRVIR